MKISELVFYTILIGYTTIIVAYFFIFKPKRNKIIMVILSIVVLICIKPFIIHKEDNIIDSTILNKQTYEFHSHSTQRTRRRFGGGTYRTSGKWETPR